jgi:hypothetical protein
VSVSVSCQTSIPTIELDNIDSSVDYNARYPKAYRRREMVDRSIFPSRALTYWEGKVYIIKFRRSFHKPK